MIVIYGQSVSFAKDMYKYYAFLPIYLLLIFMASMSYQLLLDNVRKLLYNLCKEDVLRLILMRSQCVLL